MERKHVSQLQCPKCGETQMMKMVRFNIGHILLSIFTFGLYAVLAALIASKDRDPTVKRGDRVKCKSCGSVWIFEQ